MFKFCKQCKNKYFKKINISKKNWRKSNFCSHRCHSDSLKGKIGFFTGMKHTKETIQKIKKNRVQPKMTARILFGLECGRHKIWTSEMREKLRKAALKRKLGHGIGKKSSAWRGGLTKIVRLYRLSKRYTEWRLKVYIRDGFRCQKCKQTGKKLEAHHKKSVRDIFKEYKIKTVEQMYKCKILFDVSNGLTLCKDCHKETDTFGSN